MRRGRQQCRLRPTNAGAARQLTGLAGNADRIAGPCATGTVLGICGEGLLA